MDPFILGNIMKASDKMAGMESRENMHDAIPDYDQDWLKEKDKNPDETDIIELSLDDDLGDLVLFGDEFDTDDIISEEDLDEAEESALAKLDDLGVLDDLDDIDLDTFDSLDDDDFINASLEALDEGNEYESDLDGTDYLAMWVDNEADPDFDPDFDEDFGDLDISVDD